ncbi:hypothetical protein Tco_0970010 [Tanacetum coccineum]
MSFGVPRVANWYLFDGYGFEDTLREMMKLKYIYEGDGDVFVDYSWERALGLIMEIFYPEGCRKFFSILYFDKDVDRNNLMKEKCIWFRLCGHEHILTLPKFAVVLGLFTEEEVEQVYFGKLEVDDKQFDYKDYWTRVGLIIVVGMKRDQKLFRSYLRHMNIVTCDKKLALDDKKLIGRRKTRKSEDHTLRRALCRPAGGFAARQDHDVKFPPPLFNPKAVEISLQTQKSVRTNLKEEVPLLDYVDYDDWRPLASYITKPIGIFVAFGMGTLSLVSKYFKDLEECMDDGDLRVAKEAKLFNALKHKSFVIEVDNQKNLLENMGFLHVSLSDYGRKMVNDVNVEIQIRMNLTKFKEGIDVIDLLEEVGSSSEEVVKMGKANRNKGYNINKPNIKPSRFRLRRERNES